MLLLMTRSLRRSLTRAGIERGESSASEERVRLVAYEDGVVFELAETNDEEEPCAPPPS